MRGEEKNPISYIVIPDTGHFTIYRYTFAVFDQYMIIMEFCEPNMQLSGISFRLICYLFLSSNSLLFDFSLLPISLTLTEPAGVQPMLSPGMA